jgi:prephenate dehydrogenase
VASEVTDDIKASVAEADIVILATPICTFERDFGEIRGALPAGCIVTDVGSTKGLVHRWAERVLPKNVYYVGSHPIAGSEQRGVEFARDDLFEGALCILTATPHTNRAAVKMLQKFWMAIGCTIKIMRPAQHDRILAQVSHLPHITAVSLVNANNIEDLKFAGKGFIDTTRIASGPANIWVDVLLTNANNITKGIDRITAELGKMKAAIKNGDRKKIEKLLEAARNKRNEMIKYKMRKKEIIP